MTKNKYYYKIQAGPENTTIKMRLDKRERAKLEAIKLFLIERGHLSFTDEAVMRWVLEKAYIDALVNKIFSYEMPIDIDEDEPLTPAKKGRRAYNAENIATGIEKMEQKPTDWTIPVADEELKELRFNV